MWRPLRKYVRLIYGDPMPGWLHAQVLYHFLTLIEGAVHFEAQLQAISLSSCTAVTEEAVVVLERIAEKVALNRTLKGKLDFIAYGTPFGQHMHTRIEAAVSGSAYFFQTLLCYCCRLKRWKAKSTRPNYHTFSGSCSKHKLHPADK